MNNLHRELAPISDAAWAQIEEETTRTLKRYLAGRRIVDVPSSGGIALPGVGTGHLKPISAPRRRDHRKTARGEAAGGVAGSVCTVASDDRRCGARLRGLRLAACEGRREEAGLR